MDAATRNGIGAGGAGVVAIVEYDYTAKEPDELDLVKGAIIHNIKQMPGGWWEGTLQATGKSGMFPDNFVRLIDANDDNAVTLREKSAASNRRCKVIYSYTQVNDDELSLAVGDVIEFLGEVEEGWWRGRLKTKVGVFPSNFVVAIDPSPVLASKRPLTLAAQPPAAATAPPPSAASYSSAAAAKTMMTAYAGTAGATTTTSSSSSASASASSSTMTTTTSAASSMSTKKTNRLSFHSSKEDLLDDLAPSLPPKPQRDFCRVEFPYAPQNEDELELKVGDIITVINMDLPDKGWWKGELRGKVGVFPDNFVKLMGPSEVSPLNDLQYTQRTSTTATTAKTANVSTAGAPVAAAATSSSHLTSATSTTNATTHAASPSSKVFIKKSGSTSSSQSSNRKDSFGSRDSLNDILSETGLPSGNVAAQRKSLENKNLDLSGAPDASNRLGLKKHQLHQESKATTISTSYSSTMASASELRKSVESLDERAKTTPPVLTKKPSVPTKKSTTVTSVAGNLLSGLKQKVKNVENKLTTTVSHDYADGVGSSRMSHGGGLPDAAPGGHIVMRRAATIAVEDSDFDRVERSSILPDVRAGRVRAPKRRPPSAAINVIGESNNNNSVYLNGSGGAVSADHLLNNDNDGKPHSSDENSTGEGDQLAKPKPREWEKKKAPWMEELKASQVKKKTSPSVEPRTLLSGSGVGGVAERSSKSLVDDTKIASGINTTNNTSANVTSSSSTSSSVSSTTTKVQSTSVTSSSVMQQSMTVERKELHQDVMAKSSNAKLTADTDDVRARPNTLSIRNRSISPAKVNAHAHTNANSNASSANTRSVLKSSASPASTNLADSANATSTTTAYTAGAISSASTAKSSTTLVNNNHHENNLPAMASGKTTNINHAHNATDASVDGASGSRRVGELERRVEKLEAVVHAQQRTIDDLVRTLREETDRVKVLRGELDKYAQKQTRRGKFDNWMF